MARARREVRFTVWALNDRVRKWLPLDSGLSEQAAVEDMLERQDRVRRSGYATRFVVRPDGKKPDDRA